MQVAHRPPDPSPTGERLVMPPLPASLLVGAVYALLTATMPLHAALPLFSGMGYGYVLYDCIHYMLHSPKGWGSEKGGFWQRFPLVGELLKDLRHRHMHHHFRDHTKGYGISSTFFDAVLNTSNTWNRAKGPAGQ